MKSVWRAALLTGAALAVPAAINVAIGRQRRELRNALPGDSAEYAWPLGTIHYQVRGEGPALLLVHGLGAGASSYEFRHNFDTLSAYFRVFALDLPGFGRSERRNLPYSADLYTLALMDFLRDVAQQPASILASSLSAAYAVRVAAQRPELVEKLVLICPTGMKDTGEGAPVWGPLSYGALSLPAIGVSIYNGIASSRYIESYMRENLYVEPARVTPALVEHYYHSAHQPGGQYALRSLISGLLNGDITEIFPDLPQPVLIAWGRQARITPVENAQRFLSARPETRLRIFEHSRLLPHDEEADDFNATALSFLADKEFTSLPEPPPQGTVGAIAD